MNDSAITSQLMRPAIRSNSALRPSPRRAIWANTCGISPGSKGITALLGASGLLIGSPVFSVILPDPDFGSPPCLDCAGLVHVHHCRHLAEVEHLLGRARCEEVHQAGDDARPAGLMAGAEAGAVVAVEVLVEQHTVAPVRVVLELPGPAVHGPPPVLVLEEDARQPAR